MLKPAKEGEGGGEFASHDNSYICLVWENVEEDVQHKENDFIFSKVDLVENGEISQEF